MIIVFDYDESRKLGILKSDALDYIRESFSQFDEQAAIKKRVSRYKHIPSRLYCITKGGKFELGMTSDIIRFVKKSGVPYRMSFTDAFKKAFLCAYDFADLPLAEINKPPKYQDRYYQEESIKKAIKIGNGIFLLKTAAGKSYIIGKLIATIFKYKGKQKALIVVPTIQLVDQMYEDLLFFGFSAESISRWSGSYKLDPTADIIIASSAILLSPTQDLSILSHIDLLIVDECHMLKRGNQIVNVIKNIKTRNRFGFTGTLPEDQIDQWSVIGKIGPVLYTVSRQELVDKNFIADAEIKIIYIDYEDGPKYQAFIRKPEYEGQENAPVVNPLVNYEIETAFVESHPYRNNVIKSLCDKLKKNVLIVVEHIEHGQTLFNILSQNKGKQVFFIRGDVEVADREKVKQIMEGNDNVVCIAISKIFSTGINIKNLHFILFALAGEAKVKIIQSIGRGVRLHENKNKLYIFDIADGLKYGKKHLRRRKEIYEEEGFKVKSVQIVERREGTLFA